MADGNLPLNTIRYLLFAICYISILLKVCQYARITLIPKAHEIIQFL
jgi:hypothetical protein